MTLMTTRSCNEDILKVWRTLAEDTDLQGPGPYTLKQTYKQIPLLFARWLQKNEATLSSLESIVYLKQLKLTHLPTGLSHLTNIEKLSLSKNLLTDIVPGVLSPSLVYLDLSHNGLIKFPEDIIQLTNLTYLNLAGNAIPLIPEEMTRLTNLETLNLSNNSIAYSECLQEQAPKLPNLILNTN